MRQPRTKANAAGPHTKDNVDFIRASVATMSDVQIATQLGWKAWKVLAVRHLHEIPAHVPKLVWSKEDIEHLKARYIAAGEPASKVGKAIGKTGVQVAKKALRLGLTRDPLHRIRNSAAANVQNSPFTPGHTIRRPAKREAAPPPPQPAHTKGRRHFGTGAINFMNPSIQHEPLGDRILRALAERPMSTPALATVTGEKELYVSMQLSAFAHEGRVQVGEGALRERRWSVASG